MLKRADGEHEFERTMLRLKARLPPEVLLFVVRGCRFVAVGDDVRAQTLSPEDAAGGHWTIILGEGETQESLIAHEIAHAWLGHTENSSESEREASELVRGWGFTGPGADR